MRTTCGTEDDASNRLLALRAYAICETKPFWDYSDFETGREAVRNRWRTEDDASNKLLALRAAAICETKPFFKTCMQELLTQTVMTDESHISYATHPSAVSKAAPLGVPLERPQARGCETKPFWDYSGFEVCVGFVQAGCQTKPFSGIRTQHIFRQAVENTNAHTGRDAAPPSAVTKASVATATGYRHPLGRETKPFWDYSGFEACVGFVRAGCETKPFLEKRMEDGSGQFVMRAQSVGSRGRYRQCDA